MLKDNEYFRNEDVRAAAYGRWPKVLATLLPEQFKDALDFPGTKQIPCAINGGKTRFRFFRESFNERGAGICNCCGPLSDGFAVLQWANKWDFTTAKEAVGELLAVTPQQGRKKTTNRTKVVVPSVSKWAEQLQERMAKTKAMTPERAKAKINAVWEEGISLCDPKAVAFIRYLQQERGIRLRLNPKMFDTEHLRFHPALPYYEETVIEKDGVKTSKWVCLGEYPAILAALRNAKGELVTVHRTFLTDRGLKAPVESPRKMMVPPSDTPVNGCSIMLNEPVDGVLGLTEGKETGWSVISATGMGLASLVNTTLMAGFDMPERLRKKVHTCVIWKDKDRSKAGTDAAETLKERLESEGYRVFVFEPPIPIPDDQKGVDWNDVLKTQGVLGFPDLRFLHKPMDTRRYG